MPGRDTAKAGDGADDSAVRYGEGFSIVNEFGSVFLRKIYTRNGERLQIVAPTLGYETRLDALQLETITWQKHEFFSELMDTPFGPKDEK